MGLCITSKEKKEANWMAEREDDLPGMMDHNHEFKNIDKRIEDAVQTVRKKKKNKSSKNCGERA